MATWWVMYDLAIKVLREFGLPTLVAVGLGGLLVYTTMSSADERATHTALLIDQLADVRERLAKIEATCVRP